MAAEGFLRASAPGDASLLAVNAMVSMLPKRRGAEAMVIDLRSVSSLTGSDYLRPTLDLKAMTCHRFSLHCGRSSYEAVEMLACHGKAQEQLA